jgi:CTP:molybdopterin cytidylyltransferase MocA/SAM-dependent methyltransferase
VRTAVAGVLLAAGEGSRLGRPKALVELNGQTLAEHGADLLRAGGADPVVVVTGAARIQLAGTLSVYNEDWRTGMGSSLRTALEALAGTDAGAAVIALADQPLVGPQAVARLIAAYRGGATVAVAAYGGQPRNPVLLAREHWPEVIAMAEGDTGARPFLRARADLVTLVECGDTGRPDDIDTPADLARVTEIAEDERRRHDLRGGFDLAAEDYQRTRPVCPPQLFDALIEAAGLGPGDRVLEIGCGTGQATVPLAERGLAITAVELGAELAAVARRRLAGFPAAKVVTSAFEDWPPEGGPFDAVVAVSSLHWIDPQLRYAKPHELLREGGAMAVAGCMWAQAPDAEPFWRDVQEDYRAVGYEGSPPPAPGQIGPRHFPPEAGTLFEEVASLRYPFQVRYSAGDYLAQLATQSGTRALGEARSADFLARVRRRLTSLGWPDLTATFVALLVVGRRALTGHQLPG